ncbi:hypothetical protein [Synechococcus sp. EJ6-Ellesmere]|uniref:hypothetical protein n=1 Tax=Synechococcus sp. EJ6-Ellesmere TaxID=2823734 RepID=UPI0020CDC70A|nr:hypothetical protein [Synechococcus sp. EJ6-Ellesmere]MCP9824497.1 hypothetical protein [Synechococcus sp. EJ6-Ellesmere]
MTAPDTTPADVSIKELETRWKLSRNGLKARARALGVELRRVSSTLTVWPGEFLELGERLHEHLDKKQPMGTFPGLAPTPGSAGTAHPLPSVPAPADPLARARALAAAADEDLPLVSDELAAVLGVPPEAIDSLKSGAMVRGFRLRRGGGRGAAGYWRVERCWRASTAPALTAGGAATDGTVPALMPAKTHRAVGFGADVIEARFEVLPPGPSLFPLPRC